jgi:hypothetical protein
MRANPGGQLDPSEIFGRDKLVARLWEVLSRQSLILTAVRRAGKTSVITKMMAEVPEDCLPIFRDLEQVHSVLEFAELVFEDVENYLSGRTRVVEKARNFIKQLSGVEAAGIKIPTVAAPHWKKVLTHIIEDIVENQECRVIFFWDEMPMMLDNIKKREGEQVAMEVLDTLRAFRQTYPNLRMVFTGSIGLHHVVTALKQKGYSSSPTNDMYVEEVPPLSADSAEELARLLITGEQIQTVDPAITAQAIAQGVDCVPFYIHHVVDQLRQSGGSTDAIAIEELITACVTDEKNCWDLEHYRERIQTYYAADEQTLALHLLDILAVAALPLSFDELFNLLQIRVATEDQEQVRHVLKMLQRDHYLTRESDGKFCFRFQLIQRWWRWERGL